MKTLDYIALTLIIIGALNWGLIGFFQLDLIAYIFGGLGFLTRAIYVLVGLSALYAMTLYSRLDKTDTVKIMD